jgi:hypothetical protein
MFINSDEESEKTPKMRYNQEDNEEITERLLEWIIDAKLAFSVV